MAHYRVTPNRQTLHGVLDKTLPPALRIQPGDTVSFRTLEGDWRLEKTESPATDSGNFFPRRMPGDAGHALCGPVYIEGAEPGMTLAVRLDQVVPAHWGWSRVGGGDKDHMRRLGWGERDEYFVLWDLDVCAGIGRSHLGHRVALNPFPGVLATCPNSDEPVPTHPPGNHGANLDCKEIVQGSTLYLPVYVKGALFSVGDGHACQGDGESGCTAIECPMDDVTITFSLVEESIQAPVCKTPTGWVTFGFHQDLTEANYTALDHMIRLMQRLYGYSAQEATMLSALVVDLRTTQIVNGIRGAHAFLPHGSLHR